MSSPARATIEESQENDFKLQTEFPSYVDQTARLNTYRGWPDTSHKCPSNLSAAGLFYNGDGERVSCFSCGFTKLDAWSRRDDPWKVHALEKPQCDYLLMTKGKEFVDSVLDDYRHNISKYYQRKMNRSLEKARKRWAKQEEKEKKKQLLLEQENRKKAEQNDDDDEQNKAQLN